MADSRDISTAPFRAVTRTNPGKRDNNEDVSVLAEGPAHGRPAGDILFGVVDGMGGYQAGEVASAIARDRIYECFAVGGSDVAEWPLEAHRAIVADAQDKPERAGMGAVLTIGLISDGALHLGHVGDSRLYRLRAGKLEQISQDQSAVGDLVRAGKLRKDVARTHHMSNVVYQAVGHPDRMPEPFVKTFDVRQGDLYLACSDGLTDVITDEQVQEIVAGTDDLDAAAESLIMAALTDQEAVNVNDEPVRVPGGRDNITVALVRVLEGVAPEPEQEGPSDSSAKSSDTPSGAGRRVAHSASAREDGDRRLRGIFRAPYVFTIAAALFVVALAIVLAVRSPRRDDTSEGERAASDSSRRVSAERLHPQPESSDTGMAPATVEHAPDTTATGNMPVGESDTSETGLED